MLFKTIDQLVKSGRTLKIHVIDYLDPYLFTGRVVKAYTDEKGTQRVDLHPFIGLRIRAQNPHHFTTENPYIGLVISPEKPEADAGSAGPILMHNALGPTKMRVTTGVKTHERYAAALMRRLCQKDMDVLEEYFLIARQI